MRWRDKCGARERRACFIGDERAFLLFFFFNLLSTLSIISHLIHDLFP